MEPAEFSIDHNAASVQAQADTVGGHEASPYVVGMGDESSSFSMLWAVIIVLILVALFMIVRSYKDQSKDSNDSSQSKSN